MSRSRLKRGRAAVLLAVLSVSLAACGTNAADRMGGGTAGGAATGATFGLIGGPIGVLVGGAIGGGIGALTAANTTPKQVNLGNPPWASSNSASAPTTNQPADLRGQINQYQSQRNAQSGDGYGKPQQLMPANGTAQGSYSDGIQSEPLAPPSTR